MMVLAWLIVAILCLVGILGAVEYLAGEMWTWLAISANWTRKLPGDLSNWDRLSEGAGRCVLPALGVGALLCVIGLLVF